MKLPSAYKPALIKKIELHRLRGQQEILEWAGYAEFSTIFVDYLNRKYKTECSMQEIHVVTFEETDRVVKLFTSCIHKKLTKPIFMFIKIPMGVEIHSNIIIYRPLTKTLEHFEPLGSLIYDFVSKDKMHRFMVAIKEGIQKLVGPIELLHPVDICPSANGLQRLEGKSKIQKKTRGYCVAWNLFFIELVLCNPTVPSKELLHDILTAFTRFERSKTYDNFTHIINGYVYLLYEKFEKYVTYDNKKITMAHYLESKKGKHPYGFLDLNFKNITPLSLPTKRTRCKNGTRKNKTGECVPK